MAYSELVKNFDRIRDYMRQFYVYGFKSRTEYDKKGGQWPPNIFIISNQQTPCLFSLSPTFCPDSYETSHLAKSRSRMYDEDTKKE